VPDQAVLDFEIRHLARGDADAIVGTVVRKATAIVAPHLARFSDAAIDIEIRNRYPGLDMPADCDAVNRVQAILGKGTESIKVAFGTEAGLFHERLGVPAIVCGPGSMEQGHRADEFRRDGAAGGLRPVSGKADRRNYLIMMAPGVLRSRRHGSSSAHPAQ
jgi:acetylornithine deacetylase